MFNTQKRKYAQRNEYMKEENYHILNLEKNVKVVPAGCKILNWDDEFVEIYRRSRCKTIPKNHYFSFKYYHIKTNKTA